jgi:hypothetical protein
MTTPYTARHSAGIKREAGFIPPYSGQHRKPDYIPVRAATDAD